jgi:hypothetical protein
VSHSSRQQRCPFIETTNRGDIKRAGRTVSRSPVGAPGPPSPHRRDTPICRKRERDQQLDGGGARGGRHELPPGLPVRERSGSIAARRYTEPRLLVSSRDAGYSRSADDLLGDAPESDSVGPAPCSTCRVVPGTPRVSASGYRRTGGEDGRMQNERDRRRLSESHRIRRPYSYSRGHGGSGIRTHEASRPPAFQAGTLVRSVIPPLRTIVRGASARGKRAIRRVG